MNTYIFEFINNGEVSFEGDLLVPCTIELCRKKYNFEISYTCKSISRTRETRIVYDSDIFRLDEIILKSEILARDVNISSCFSDEYGEDGAPENWQFCSELPAYSSEAMTIANLSELVRDGIISQQTLTNIKNMIMDNIKKKYFHEIKQNAIEEVSKWHLKNTVTEKDH